MATFVQRGEAIDYTPEADVAAGAVVVQGGLLGVAKSDIPAGQLGALHLSGVFRVAKLAELVLAMGVLVYWDDTAKEVTNDPDDGANLPMGTVVKESGASDETVEVKLLERALPPLALLALASDKRVAFGVHTQVAAVDTVETGLTTVEAVVATLESDPDGDCTIVSASIGDQDEAPVPGSVYLKAWKPTDANTTTPTAATTLGQTINWIAIGT